MKERKVEIVASSESEFEIQKSKFGRGYEEIILVIHPLGPRIKGKFMSILELSCIAVIWSHRNFKAWICFVEKERDGRY